MRFSSKDWDRISSGWSAWWHHEIDRPMVVVDSLKWQGKWFVQHHEGWDADKNIFPIDPVLDYYQGLIEEQIYYGDSWPHWWPNFGPGIMAGFVGADVENDENTIWFDPPCSMDLEEIVLNYDQGNFWWNWVRELTRTAVDHWGSQVTVAHTDIGGNLDILASLRGTQNLLMDLYDSPEEVERLAERITQLWLRYYDELYTIIHSADNGTTSWTPLWCPERYYMLQCDFAYMISPAMFERFVMPDLLSCCDHLDFSFYHLDGKGQIRHLEMLLSIEGLHGIQWVPGDGQPPAWVWLQLLKRIRDGNKLCQIYTSPAGALDVVRELGGKGFAFWITDPYPQEELEAFFDTLETLL